MNRSRIAVLVLALAAATAAGCGSGPPSPPPVASPGPASPTPGTASPPVSADPATPTPVIPPIPDSPPEVALAADGGEPIAGDLGTFSWDGLVSDAPWIVGRAGVAVAADGTLEATVAGDLQVRDWTVRWAQVAGGQAEPVGDGATSGLGLPIAFRPPGPGAWSVAVEVWYADVGRAAWYWRVNVGP